MSIQTYPKWALPQRDLEMYSTVAWAKASPEAEFSKIEIKRNFAGDDDVTFDIKYCGICHTDVHFCDNLMGMTKFPCVPGHELAGVVSAVGKNVTKYKVGDHVGVGCIVDSCMNCLGCEEGEEQLCAQGMTMTYNDKTKHGNLATDSGWTYGGYSKSHTANQRFIVKIPDGFPLEAAGPVFCAGITMYSPLVNYKADKGGMRVGIIGIGGLGQMGVRLAKAMGNTVTAISTSPNKEEAAKKIGADNFVVSTNPESMKAAGMSLDLILNVVSANHDLNHYLPLLANKGVLVQMGLVLTPHPVVQAPLMFRKLTIAGSLIGGLPETQACIDFCSKHKIVPKIKMVTAKDLGTVYKELQTKNDSIVRNVLDIEASQ
eukprot:TRINITY_DN1879_c0_g1_i1.p1 TRINITY_DN1879_c0_g1~~TRINITY_DN1879_c0_g1_i1.p1  ORF type:complete len:373 (-),score=97.18 TRINITY_DN1879_c0_g1_i1:75-1193(-)